MTLENLKQAWEDLGHLDPFWAMTGDKEYRLEIEKFLSTGDTEISRVITLI